jgi:hypothetical protein
MNEVDTGFPKRLPRDARLGLAVVLAAIGAIVWWTGWQGLLVMVGVGAGMWLLLPDGSPDVETARERLSAEEKAKDYVTAGEFRNDAGEDLVLCLEIFGEEVILSPGHVVELLVPPDPGLLPLEVERGPEGITICANGSGDPDWHLRFNGQILKPGYPTRLADHL